ncbi:hypothetical protein AVO45_19160 [Ruegeria marisrubri]|uniref:Uncharacterized protein n=1 Tax=Ruegeria marisrubri TaxID=1685379 RepID=A0A0X3TRU4_9RHOB|nr:hypothetical protein AVO45_19160 [Ruegeria marisrubri]
MQTYLLMTCMTFAARSAPADERYGDPVAHVPVPYVFANRLDHAGQFVARDVRKYDIAVVTHPTVPVATTDASRFDLEDDTMRLR